MWGCGLALFRFLFHFHVKIDRSPLSGLPSDENTTTQLLKSTGEKGAIES